jgi:hypothetical protein
VKKVKLTVFVAVVAASVLATAAFATTKAANSIPVASVDPGAGGQNGLRSIVIRGSGFEPGATPSFSGTGITVLSTTLKSATKFVAQIEIDGDAATGSRDVTVTNGEASSGTCVACFVVDPAPKPTSASPAQASRGTTLDVDVLGSDFQPGAEVKILPGDAGVSVNSTTYVDAGHLKANITVASDAEARRAAVKVVDPDGGRGTCTACLVIVP